MTSDRVLVGNLQKFSLEDGPGIRTTVFLKGCPLHCRWCHNPELIDPQQQLIKLSNKCIGCGYCVDLCPQNAMIMSAEKGVIIDRTQCDVCLKCTEGCYAQALKPVAKSMAIDEILDIAEQDKGFYDKTEGGITVSGGEVLMYAEFVSRLIDEAGKRSMNVCIDTCGFGDSQALMEMALRGNVTHILYDMKAIDDEVHRQYTGVSNRSIIANLRMLAADMRTKEKLIMRMPLIRGINDGDDMIESTGRFYKEIAVRRLTLIPYHSFGINKKINLGGAQDKFEQPTEKRMTEIARYFRDEIKLDVEILGNIEKA